MPTAAAGAAASAGTQLFGQAIGAASQFFQNRQSQNWSRDMYKRQYADNIAFWEKQNKYNSPSAQMQRFRDAGLNPALMYGGSVGGAAGNASPIKTPDVQKAQFNTPNFSGLATSGLTYINQLYDLEIKQAQSDNLRADNTVKLEEAAYKQAQRRNTEAGTDRSKFDLALDSELRTISADARKEQLRQLKVSTDKTLRDDERAAAMNSSNLKEAAERILSMRAQRANTKEQKANILAKRKNISLDNNIKQLDIDLRRMGVNPNDPLYMRMLGRLLNQGDLFNNILKY